MSSLTLIRSTCKTRPAHASKMATFNVVRSSHLFNGTLSSFQSIKLAIRHGPKPLSPCQP